MRHNLRHLRVFVAVEELGSISRAADACHVSQPAVSQAISKLEQQFGLPLFVRKQNGFFASRAGTALALRVRRALNIFDAAASEFAPRLRITATTAQLEALIAMAEIENFTLTARRLGLAQPTIHKSIGRLEQEAGQTFFERSEYGITATSAAKALALATRLAFAELDQADSDLAELSGLEVGKIVVGALPLSQARLLPEAITRFRSRRATLPIKIIDGRYDDLIAGLRRGEIDFLIGALRHPTQICKLVQRTLFDDKLIVVAGPDHPLRRANSVDLERLASFPWIVAISGTPTRAHFDQLFSQGTRPTSLVETGSMVLMRELLSASDHLAFISKLQVQSDLAAGTLIEVPCDLPDTTRSIGITTRADWVPTRAQADLLQDIFECAPTIDFRSRDDGALSASLSASALRPLEYRHL